MPVSEGRYHTDIDKTWKRFRVGGLLLLLALPRLLRMAHPQVWIEDESYLNGAFMLARGFQPYRDFPLPHFPALEALMAAIFLVAPVTVRTAEAVTQLAAFCGSVLVFAVGRRLGGFAVGTLAALVFATSALVFRYHVFEREVFVVVPVLGAMLVAMRPAAAARAARDGIAVGALMFVALAIKLTAAAACAALLAYLLLDGRQRTAARAAMTALLLLVVTTIACAARFGRDFIVQVFVFRAVHATFPSLGVKLDELRYSMDISLALGAGGIVLIVWSGDVRRWIAPLLQLLSGFAFLVLINPTFWAHTGIELLPWLSLTSGFLLTGAIHAFGTSRRTPAIACVAASLLLLAFVTPIRNLNWQAGDESVYGFGYRDRSELERIGAFVRAHSASDALVATPPIIAFIANRREVVPYREIAGEVDEIADIVRKDGYRAALTSRSLRGRSFWDSVEASRERTMPILHDALASRRLAVVINDSPDDLMPVRFIDEPNDRLEGYGYQLATVSTHYDVWTATRGG